MKRNGSLITSHRMICSVLLFVLTLLTIQVQAQTGLGAKCTGKPDVAWSEQIVGCSRAIESGKYVGKDLAKAFDFRGTAYAQTGDIDRGLADIEQAIRLDPSDTFALGARGDLDLVRKDYERAIADYTTVISVDPNNAPSITGRAMAYFVTGDLDRAIADCDQAIRAQPTFAPALYWRGLAKRAKGDAVAGEADIAAAKKIDPEVDR